MGFSRQEYWSGWPFPPPGDLFNPGIEPGSPALQVDSSPSQPPEKLRKSIICHQGKLSWKHQEKKARLLGLGFPKSRSKHEMKNSGKIWNQIEPLFPIISPFLPHYPSPPHTHTHIHTHAFQEQIEVVRLEHREQKQRGCVHRVAVCRTHGPIRVRNQKRSSSAQRRITVHNHLRTLHTSGQQPLELDIRRWASIDSQSAASGSSGDVTLIPLVQFNPHVKA